MIHDKINSSHFTVEQRKKANFTIQWIIHSFIRSCKASHIDIPLPNPFINDELVLHIEKEIERGFLKAIEWNILECIYLTCSSTDQYLLQPYLKHELTISKPFTSDIRKWFKSVFEIHVNFNHKGNALKLEDSYPPIEDSPYYNELLEYILKKTFIRGF